MDLQSAITTITDDNFQDEVLNSELPVLIDFWAIWCGPCKMIAPIVEELATEYDGKAYSQRSTTGNAQGIWFHKWIPEHTLEKCSGKA